MKLLKKQAEKEHLTNYCQFVCVYVYLCIYTNYILYLHIYWCACTHTCVCIYTQTYMHKSTDWITSPLEKCGLAPNEVFCVKNDMARSVDDRPFFFHWPKPRSVFRLICEIIWDLSKLSPSSSVSTNTVQPNTQKSFQFVHYRNQLLDLVFLAKEKLHRIATYTLVIHPFLLGRDLAVTLLD